MPSDSPEHGVKHRVEAEAETGGAAQVLREYIEDADGLTLTAYESEADCDA